MHSGPTITFQADSQLAISNALTKIREVIAKHNETQRQITESDPAHNPEFIILTPEQEEQGAILLVSKKFLDLNNPAIASNYIRRIMLSEINAALEEQASENHLLEPLAPTVLNAARNKPAASNRELKNIKKVRDLSGYKENVKGKRFSRYVIALGEPKLPARHPGVDDSYHPDKDLDQEYLDLLERGHTTLQYIKSLPGRACPRLLYLRSGVQPTEDALTKKIHKGHTLEDTLDNITKEMQSPIVFHFAGHGNQEKVGPITFEKRITPKELAEQFDQIVESCKLKEVLLSKKQPLEFYFDICNSALVDVSIDDNKETLKSKVLTESVIGKFAEEMNKLGYNNIIVHGYRGYYVAQKNGSGISVTDSINDSPNKRYLIGEKALHTVKVINGQPQVILPKELANATFPVVLLPTSRLTPTMN